MGPAAGFDDITCSSSTRTYAPTAERAWWGVAPDAGIIVPAEEILCRA